MQFKLQSFDTPLTVSRIANIHYFEFTNKYHTRKDKHEFRELVYVDNSSVFVDSEHYYGELKKNQLIIHQASEVHSLTCPEDEPANVIIIGFECKEEILDRFSDNPVTLTADLQKALTEIIKEGRSVFLPPYDALTF